MWIDHDDGHSGGYPHECNRCECGWYVRPHVYGGETMAEHQAMCSVHRKSGAQVTHP